MPSLRHDATRELKDRGLGEPRAPVAEARDRWAFRALGQHSSHPKFLRQRMAWWRMCALIPLGVVVLVFGLTLLGKGLEIVLVVLKWREWLPFVLGGVAFAFAFFTTAVLGLRASTSTAFTAPGGNERQAIGLAFVVLMLGLGSLGYGLVSADWASTPFDADVSSMLRWTGYLLGIMPLVVVWCVILFYERRMDGVHGRPAHRSDVGTARAERRRFLWMVVKVIGVIMACVAPLVWLDRAGDRLLQAARYLLEPAGADAGPLAGALSELLPWFETDDVRHAFTVVLAWACLLPLGWLALVVIAKCWRALVPAEPRYRARSVHEVLALEGYDHWPPGEEVDGLWRPPEREAVTERLPPCQSEARASRWVELPTKKPMSPGASASSQGQAVATGGAKEPVSPASKAPDRGADRIPAGDAARIVPSDGDLALGSLAAAGAPGADTGPVLAWPTTDDFLRVGEVLLEPEDPCALDEGAALPASSGLGRDPAGSDANLADQRDEARDAEAEVLALSNRYGAPPTRQQQGALKALTERACSVLSEADDKGVGYERDADVLLSGAPGSGRSSVLIAAALLRAIEGGRASLVLVGREPVGLPGYDDSLHAPHSLVRRIRDIAARSGLGWYLRVASLRHDDVRSWTVGTDLAPLPDIAVGTPSQYEDSVYGAPDGAHSGVHAALVRMQGVFVEDLSTFDPKERMHVAFMVAKHRLVLASEGHVMQACVALPDVEPRVAQYLARSMFPNLEEGGRVRMAGLRRSRACIARLEPHIPKGTTLVDAVCRLASVACQPDARRGHAPRVLVAAPTMHHRDQEALRQRLRQVEGRPVAFLADLDEAPPMRAADDVIAIVVAPAGDGTIDSLRVRLCVWNMGTPGDMDAAPRIIHVIQPEPIPGMVELDSSRAQLPDTPDEVGTDEGSEVLAPNSELLQSMAGTPGRSSHSRWRPVLPSVEAEGFHVAHLASAFRHLAPWAPVPRDAWDRLGLAGMSVRRNAFPPGIPFHAREGSEMRIDPPEHRSRGLRVRRASIWDWVALDLPRAQAALRERGRPTSVAEQVEPYWPLQRARGKRVQRDRAVLGSAPAMNHMADRADSEQAGVAGDQPTLLPTLLYWRGQENLVHVDLAYIDQLRVLDHRSGRSYYASSIYSENDEDADIPSRLTAIVMPHEHGKPGQFLHPVWNMHLPVPAPRRMVPSTVGPAADRVAWFDVLPRAVNSWNVPEARVALVGRYDSRATRVAQLPPVEISYKCALGVLRLTSQPRPVVGDAPCAGWSTQTCSKEDDGTRRAPWEALSAAMTAALRQQAPELFQFARLAAFQVWRPETEPSSMPDAELVFVEPWATRHTVREVMEGIRADSESLTEMFRDARDRLAALVKGQPEERADAWNRLLVRAGLLAAADAQLVLPDEASVKDAISLLDACGLAVNEAAGAA